MAGTVGLGGIHGKVTWEDLAELAGARLLKLGQGASSQTYRMEHVERIAALDLGCSAKRVLTH